MTQANSFSPELFEEMFMFHKAIKLLIDVESGDIILANHAAVDFYGYTKSEFSKLKISDLNTLPQEILQKDMQAALSNKINYFSSLL